jgi:hypothetical protein
MEPIFIIFSNGLGLFCNGWCKKDFNGNQLLTFATISYKQENQYSSGIYRKYVENILQNEFLDTENWSVSQNLTGLLNLYYSVGERFQLSLIVY